VGRKTVEAASALGIPVDPHDPRALAKLRREVEQLMAGIEKRRPGTTAGLPRLPDDS
jgi:hypothetical protein